MVNQGGPLGEIDASITVLTALGGRAEREHRILARELTGDGALVPVGHPGETADHLLEEVARVVPDVVVLHERVAGADTPALVGRLGEIAPATRVVLVATADGDAPYEAVLAGASGVVVAESLFDGSDDGLDSGADPAVGLPAAGPHGTHDEPAAVRPTARICAATRAVARGGAVFTAGCARRLLEDAPRADTAPEDPFGRGIGLTAVEQLVLRQLADGATVRQIAEEREVTERLVAQHLGYAVAKLHDFVRRTLLHRRLRRPPGAPPVGL